MKITITVFFHHFFQVDEYAGSRSLDALTTYVSEKIESQDSEKDEFDVSTCQYHRDLLKYAN